MYEVAKVSDGIVWDWVAADVTADAKDMMKEHESQRMDTDKTFLPNADHRAAMPGKTLYAYFFCIAI